MIQIKLFIYITLGAVDVEYAMVVLFRSTFAGQTAGDPSKGLTRIASEYPVVQNVVFCFTTVALEDQNSNKMKLNCNGNVSKLIMDKRIALTKRDAVFCHLVG